MVETEFMLREPDEYAPTLVEVDQHILETASATSRILVAESADELVGFLEARGSTLKRLQHSAVIFMGVLKHSWGQGVARGLLLEVLQWAPSVGLERLELTVDFFSIILYPLPMSESILHCQWS